MEEHLENQTVSTSIIEEDCVTLYETARSLFENNKTPSEARHLFQKVIDLYPSTHEAQYAADFIKKIDHKQDKDDFKLQQDMKLEFKGTAKEYFRIWVVNLCLTLLTFGIFSAWAKVRKKRYFYSHLTLDETPFQYLGQPIPILKGRIIASILFLLYYTSTNVFTALFPYVLGAGLLIAPWVIVQSVSFNARYSAFRNMTFRFNGTYADSFKVLSAWGLIPAMVIGNIFAWWGKYWMAGIVYGLFGIIFPWWLNRLKKFIVTYTSYGGCPGQFGATGGDFFRVYFMSGVIIMGFAMVTGLMFAITGIVAGESLTAKIPYATIIGILPIYAGYVLAFAYVNANITNAVWNKIQLGPLRFRCTLKGPTLAKIYLTNALAIIASAGLLIPWAVIRTFKYRTDQTQVKQSNNITEFQGQEADKVSAAGAEVSEFFDLDLAI